MRAAALFLALTLLTACEPAPAEPPPSVSDLPAPSASSAPLVTFRYGLGEPGSLLPGEVADAGGLVIADALFDGLTAWTLEGRPQPCAALTWQADPVAGPSLWTFTLRPGATYHDGTPVRAADFVAAWTRLAAAGPYGHLLEGVTGYADLRAGASTTLAGVSAPDARTLVVQLERPNAEFPALVGHPALAPLPQAATTDPGSFAASPIGNGPFRVADPWAHGRFLRVQRFADWANGPRAGQGGLDEVVFTFRDPQSAYLDFQQDTLDFSPLPPGTLVRAREQYGDSGDGYHGPGVLDGRTPQLYFLGFDMDAPPFDQPEVRRAVSLAIDRFAVVEGTQGGNADVAGGLVPFAVPGSARRFCPTCRHDPDTARTLFAQAGVTELELAFNAGGGHERVAGILRGQFAEVGVTLREHVIPPEGAGDSSLAPYLDALRAGQVGLFRFGWVLDVPTFDDALPPLVASWSAGVDGAANWGGYANPAVDEALTAGAAETDTARRAAAFRRAERLALDDQALVPLMTFRHEAVVSDRFTGFVLSPFGLPNLPQVRRAE